jgi:hypothetical protein
LRVEPRKAFHASTEVELTLKAPVLRRTLAERRWSASRTSCEFSLPAGVRSAKRGLSRGAVPLTKAEMTDSLVSWVLGESPVSPGYSLVGAPLRLSA